MIDIASPLHLHLVLYGYRVKKTGFPKRPFRNHLQKQLKRMPKVGLGKGTSIDGPLVLIRLSWFLSARKSAIAFPCYRYLDRKAWPMVLSLLAPPCLKLLASASSSADCVILVSTQTSR